MNSLYYSTMLLHTGKAYDASKVLVSSIPWGTIGKAVDFTVDASKAGEGNLEITISARGRNIPTQVHPQGSAKFMVSFVPLEGIDHIISITFNKELVPGAPFTAKIHTGMTIDNNELFDTANDYFFLSLQTPIISLSVDTRWPQPQSEKCLCSHCQTLSGRWKTLKLP